MDSELPHCTVCLKPLAAGWRCPEHKEKALPMSGEPMTKDNMVERVARAIADCEWDQACSALGTPNYPRGSNWTSKLPQARAAIATMHGSDSGADASPPVDKLREALFEARRDFETIQTLNSYGASIDWLRSNAKDGAAKIDAALNAEAR